MQYVDRFQDVPKVKYVEVLEVHTVQKHVEAPEVIESHGEEHQSDTIEIIVPQVQYIDRIQDVPVVKHVEVPVPQVQYAGSSHSVCFLEVQEDG